MYMHTQSVYSVVLPTSLLMAFLSKKVIWHQLSHSLWRHFWSAAVSFFDPHDLYDPCTPSDDPSNPFNPCDPSYPSHCSFLLFIQFLRSIRSQVIHLYVSVCVCFCDYLLEMQVTTGSFEQTNIWSSAGDSVQRERVEWKAHFLLAVWYFPRI